MVEARYKKSCYESVVIADYAVKVYYDSSKKEIKVHSLEKIENLVVGWRSDDALEYDWVAHTSMMSLDFIEKQWGIKVKPEMDPKSVGAGTGSHGDEYGTGSKLNC